MIYICIFICLFLFLLSIFKKWNSIFILFNHYPKLQHYIFSNFQLGLFALMVKQDSNL